MDEFYDFYLSLIRNSTIFSVFKVINEQNQDVYALTSKQILASERIQLEQAEGIDQANKILNDIVELMKPEKVQRVWLEMILCRDVEELDRYLSRMLRRAFLERPDILRASENKIQVSEVLECTNIEEIILRVAERKVQELGNKGLKDIIKYLNDKLNLNFESQMPEFLEICEMFQVRNIIVHNSGIIDEKFLQNTGRTDLSKGLLFPLTQEYVSQGNLKLHEVGRALDQQFKSHFRLGERL